MRHLRQFGPAVGLGLLAAVAVVSPSFAQQQGQTITVTIGPGRDGATGTGTATLTDLGNGTTRVVLNLASTNPEMLAHIHVDACPGVGAVKYPLANPVNGQSTTIVNASLSEILQNGRSINAHQSPQQGGVYVGCGNLPVAGVQAAPAQVPARLPNTGDLGAVAPFLAAAGAGLAGAGLAMRRRFRR